MELQFDKGLTSQYHSGSQIARIVTEKWVADNMFCPRCGMPYIEHFPNNRPVADFFCSNCGSEYELKSKSNTFGHKITDGAYDTMIERITSNRNPDFFFMTYSKSTFSVTNFMLIPKHFFVPQIIEKRKPLSENARRAGWTGCNILIDEIPEQGRVEIIANGIIRSPEEIIEKVNKGNTLETKDIGARGWLLDVLNCINQMPVDLFTLNDIYSFDHELYLKHPQNHNIRPKIRPQLQLLRDKGFIEFLGNGTYKKVV